MKSIALPTLAFIALALLSSIAGASEKANNNHSLQCDGQLDDYTSVNYDYMQLEPNHDVFASGSITYFTTTKANESVKQSFGTQGSTDTLGFKGSYNGADGVWDMRLLYTQRTTLIVTWRKLGSKGSLVWSIPCVMSNVGKK